ncbi:MAG: 16S rRNA (cytosine(1402)-N(4))-methyltransferase RsmH [Firmicutes bacterium]|nr:16S rRNA (cytosine(1402)-N(4))-methyltransferase RsmH [Bacillota bacterium]
MSEYEHQPVLLNETLHYLNIKPAGIYIDATVGGAGHAYRIAERLNERGLLIGIDQDQAAIKAAQQRLASVKPAVKLLRSNFEALPQIAADLKIKAADGILFDLGVSSHQLDELERGFSYKHEAPLDMRMDRSRPFSAAHLVNTASVEELTRIIGAYGEERWAKRIAIFIDRHRRDGEIKTTLELAEIIKEAIPAAARRSGPHPARRTFQALRIAVNNELEVLETALEAAISLLGGGGRIVVISFHSLEDRIVKNAFAKWAKGCQCPKEMPDCRCDHRPKLKVLTKKPIVPSADEIKLNSRARSSKLRSAEKLV